MNKDERIQGLIEANNANMLKRRGLATALREVRDLLPANFIVTREVIDDALKDNGPS